MNSLLIFIISTLLVHFSTAEPQVNGVADAMEKEVLSEPLRSATYIQDGINDAIKAQNRDNNTAYFKENFTFVSCSGTNMTRDQYVDLLSSWHPNGASFEIRNPDFPGSNLFYEMTETVSSSVYKTETNAVSEGGKWIITDRVAIGC